MKVDFEDRKYWKTQKCNNLIKPANFLAKSTSDVLCNFVFIFHWDDGVISMNFHPIWPVIYARSNLTGRIWNSTGHEILLKLGWNSMDLLPIRPAMKYCSNSVEIHGFTPSSTRHEILLKLGWNSMDLLPIQPVKFDWAWNTAQIGSKSIEMIPNSTREGYNVISVNFNPFWAVFHAQSNFKFDRAWNTAQNGCKFTEMDWNWVEIHCMPAWSNWVSSQWIYSHFEQYFMPGQIWPVEFDRAWNTAQFGLKFMDLHPIWAVFQAWLNWVSSQWIYSHFEQYFLPSRIWPASRIRPVKLGVNPWRLRLQKWPDSHTM